MINIKKTIFSIFTAAAIGLTVAACGETPKDPTENSVGKVPPNSVEQQTKLESIKARGKISVFCDPNFPPFEYIKGLDPAGVDIDIANAIAADLGVEAEINSAEFDAIIMSLASGKGDIAISGMTITEERKKEVDFSIPYIKSTQYLLILNDSDIKTMEDLAGKKIGAALGYTGSFVLEDEIADGVLSGTGVTPIIVNSANEGALELINGKIDALIMDEFVAKTIAADNATIEAIELVYEDGESIYEEYGVAVSKGNEDLLLEINSTIERLISQGKIEAFLIEHSQHLAR